MCFFDAPTVEKSWMMLDVEKAHQRSPALPRHINAAIAIKQDTVTVFLVLTDMRPSELRLVLVCCNLHTQS